MKKSKLLLILITLMLSINAFTQSDDGFRKAQERVEKQRELKIALEQSSKISPAAQKLDEDLKNSVSSDDHDRLILASGKAGDKSVIEYLKILAEQGSAKAEVALSKLGEEEYFAQIVSQTEKQQPYFKRFDGVEKLFLMIDDKRAMKRLFELLDDTEKSPSERHVIVYPIANEIILRLAKTVENPPRLSNGNVDYSIPAWKAWFAKNNHLIE